MKKICIIGAGHAFKHQYLALKNLEYEILVCDIDKEKIKGYKNIITDYKKIPEDYKLVLISTPPSTHYEIIKYLSKSNKKIICEKPLVINTEEIKELEDEKYQFYNILHFSFGEEIEYFINNKYSKKKPIYIKAYINDPYIENSHIKQEQLALNGSYLDETINPLSAIKRIYQKDIQYIKSKKTIHAGDNYDYKSNSQFMSDDIKIDIFVEWNDNSNKEKYIDIYYEDEIIRLDSFNKSVINLTTNEVLFRSDEERMYMHYLNAFKDFEKIIDNKKESLKLNYEILRGV